MLLKGATDEVKTGSGNGSAWANFDWELCGHMASLGHNELTHYKRHLRI